MPQSLNRSIVNSSTYLTQPFIKNSITGKKVYFGTGLASQKEESCGLGFEFLNTALTSLVIMKELNADGVLHEIGTVGYNTSADRRSELIKEQLNIVKKMIKSLGIEEFYSVETSHTYHESSFFKLILQYVKNKMRLFSYLTNFQSYGNYTVIQIAQMKFLYETEKTRVKVGWIVGSQPILEKVDKEQVITLINRGRLNEYYFDSLYRYVFPEDEFTFVYTSAGIDMLNGKKYAPYTVTKSQHRPLLNQPIKNYISEIPDSYHKRRALRSYEKTIVENWEIFFGKIDDRNYASTEDILINKLQYIQDKVLGTKANILK